MKIGRDKSGSYLSLWKIQENTQAIKSLVRLLELRSKKIRSTAFPYTRQVICKCNKVHSK